MLNWSPISCAISHPPKVSFPLKFHMVEVHCDTTGAIHSFTPGGGGAGEEGRAVGSTAALQRDWKARSQGEQTWAEFQPLCLPPFQETQIREQRFQGCEQDTQQKQAGQLHQQQGKGHQSKPQNSETIGCESGRQYTNIRRSGRETTWLISNRR